jgi:hypothetical protein
MIETREHKSAEAETDYRAVFERTSAVLGPRHPVTLEAQEGLAFARDVQGRHAEAERDYREVLAIREKVLGAKHPEVGSILLQIARCEVAQKKVTPETVKMARRAEKIYDTALGPESDNTKEAHKIRAEVERIFAETPATSLH